MICRMFVAMLMWFFSVLWVGAGFLLAQWLAHYGPDWILAEPGELSGGVEAAIVCVGMLVAFPLAIAAVVLVVDAAGDRT